MNDLINKTVVTSTGVAVCKPNIYALDITKNESGAPRVSVLNNGSELIHFDLDELSLCELVRMLQNPD
ncbi:hypothetical protein HAX39_25195 [Citrobacter freundii]|nr:hypothetical protein [Citrobacter freundii]